MFSIIQFFSFLSTSRIQWTHHSVFEQRSDAALVQGACWNAHTIDSSASAHHSGGCVLAHYLRMLQPQVGLINRSISPLMSLRLPAAQMYFVSPLTTLLISPILFFYHLNIDSVISNMKKTITNHHGKDITTLTFYSLLPHHKVVTASTYSRKEGVIKCVLQGQKNAFFITVSYFKYICF